MITAALQPVLKCSRQTYCVEALEKVFWGKLTPAVLHIHAPVELPVFTIYKTEAC